MTHQDQEPIAYDASESADDLRLYCADCADCGECDEGCPPLYRGEEWGGPVPPCESCGCEIVGLVEVES